MTFHPPTPIPEALRPRMQLVAQLLAERVDPGRWQGYTAAETLVARLQRPPSLGYALTASYHRTSDPDATITLGFLKLTSIRTKKIVSETVIEDGIEERERYDVKLTQPIKDSRTVKHAFTKTTSFAESAKQAWDVAAKAAFNASWAGIGGSLEVSAKYGQELSQQHGDSETTTDEISETFEFQGPIEFQVEAYRSKQRRQRIVQAQADIDGKLYFSTGKAAWEFSSYRTQFVPVAERTATDDIYGYDEFMQYPVPDELLERLVVPPDALIEFPVPYDEVVTQSLKEI